MSFCLERLTDADRQRIAGALFKVEHTYDSTGEMVGGCPIHQDTNPSFSYNYKKDLWNCLAGCGGGDLIELFTRVRGLGKEEGFKTFCSENGIEIGSKYGAAPATDEMQEAWQLFVPLTDAWIERMATERGWTAAAIAALDLRLQTHYRSKETGQLIAVKTPERVAMPVRDASGKLRNIRLYKPGAKEMKIISWGKGTGDSRLFPPAPSATGSPVLVCEGEADTICAISNGFNAITQTSKLKNWPPAHAQQFAGLDVVIAYDADQPGQEYAKWAAKSLAGVARSVRLLEWPEWMGRQPDGSWPEKHGQDLTDFFVRHKKTAADLRDLITIAKIYNDESGRVESIESEFFEEGPNGRLSFKSRLLAERIMRDITICSDTKSGKTYKWNGAFWEIYSIDLLKKLALQYLGLEANQSRTEDSIYQVLKLSSIPHGREMNDQAEWRCLKNGYLNIFTLELKPHAQEYYSTYMLPVTFDPHSKKMCTRFLQFLNETIQTAGPIMQVQEFMGYLLLQHCRFEKALIFLGPGSDGKSKLINLMRFLVGEENTSAVNFGDLEKSFQRASLYNKLLNTSTEIGDRFLESQFFKAIVSGDPINAEFKTKDVFEFRAFIKLVFATNKLPRMLDNSDGYFRRLLIISFKRQFAEDDPARDVNLEDKLVAELSEIFEWALVGMHRLIAQGRFTNCDETIKNLRKYRRLNNPVLCFIDDECEEGEGDEYRCDKSELYAKYVSYCKVNGYTAFGKENFYRELKTAVTTLRTSRPRNEDGTSRKREFKGLKILSSPDPPAEQRLTI